MIGHSLALVVTTAAALFPPVGWEGGTEGRDFLIHWSLLLGAALGAAAALLGVGPRK